MLIILITRLLLYLILAEFDQISNKSYNDFPFQSLISNLKKKDLLNYSFAIPFLLNDSMLAIGYIIYSERERFISGKYGLLSKEVQEANKRQLQISITRNYNMFIV